MNFFHFILRILKSPDDNASVARKAGGYPRLVTMR